MIPREDNRSKDCALVKIYEHVIDYDTNEQEDRYITSFYIKDYTEFLKTMEFCKENSISVYFNDNDSDIDNYLKKYNNPILNDLITDIWLTLPSKESIFCINISL